MSAIEKSSLRILSLEDSELDAELILRELRLGGIEFMSRRVQTRGDFEREIAGFQPDLILSDYRLPGFDGAQALAIAMERCPNVPCIIISGAVGEETAVELLKNGATDFVLKDRLARLVPAVHRALRGSCVGMQVLQALVVGARQRGDAEVMLHAQRSAQGFYERAGFTSRGAYFEEAGLPHLEFFKRL